MDDSWVLLDKTSSSGLLASSLWTSTSLGGWLAIGKPLCERIISRNVEGPWGDFGGESGVNPGFAGDLVCDLLKNPLRMLALRVVVWSIFGV